MSPKSKPKELDELLRASLLEDALDAPDAIHLERVERRGTDTVIESDDCEIIVYRPLSPRY